MMKERLRRSGGVARGTGVVFILIALAKLLKPPMLCGPDPWLSINVALFPVEIGLGWAMLHPGRGRRIGALLGASVAAGGALILSIVHFSGGSVRGCGCFGPIELPYGLHMLVCSVLFAACVFAIRTEHDRLRSEALVARVFD